MAFGSKFDIGGFLWRAACFLYRLRMERCYGRSIVLYEFLKGDVRLLHVDAKSRKYKARTGQGSGYRSITRKNIETFVSNLEYRLSFA